MFERFQQSHAPSNHTVTDGIDSIGIVGEMFPSSIGISRASVARVMLIVVAIAAAAIAMSAFTTASAPQATHDTAAATDTHAERAGVNTPAGRAVDALVSAHPGSAAALIPSGFAAKRGYTPILAAGVPINPNGACSSPITLPQSFDLPCKTHDLGYDLLRYAASTGNPLGPWARASIDQQLVDRVRATCAATDTSCKTAAELVRAGVVTNSIRQHEGVPIFETAGQIFTSTLHLGWRAVQFAAGVLGSALGRGVTALVVSLFIAQVWRRSRPLLAHPSEIAATVIASHRGHSHSVFVGKHNRLSPIT